MDHNINCNEPKSTPCMCRCPCHYKSTNDVHTGSRQKHGSAQSDVLPWKPMQLKQQQPRASGTARTSLSETRQSEPYTYFKDEETLPVAGTVISKSLIHARNIVKIMRARWETLSEPVDKTRVANRFSITGRQMSYKDNDTGNWRRESVTEGETHKHEWKYQSKVPENCKEHTYVQEPFQSEKMLVEFWESEPHSESHKTSLDIYEIKNSEECGDEDDIQQLTFGYFVDENGKDVPVEYNHLELPIETHHLQDVSPTTPTTSTGVRQSVGMYPTQSEVKTIRNSIGNDMDEILAGAESVINHSNNNDERHHSAGENMMIQNNMHVCLPLMTNPVPVKSVKAYPIQSEVKNIRKSFEEEVDEIVENVERTVDHSSNKHERHHSLGANEKLQENMHANLPPMTNPVTAKSIRAYPIQSEVKHIRKSFDEEIDQIVTNVRKSVDHSSNRNERHHSAGENGIVHENLHANLPPMINPVTAKSVKAYPIQSEVKQIRRSFDEEVDQIVTNVRRSVDQSNNRDERRFSAGENGIVHEYMHANLPPLTNYVTANSLKRYPIQSEVNNNNRKSCKEEANGIVTNVRTSVDHSNNRSERRHSAGENDAMIQENMHVNLPPMTNPVTAKSIRAYPIQSEVKNIRKSFEKEAQEIVQNAKRASVAANNGRLHDSLQADEIILNAVVEKTLNDNSHPFLESEISDHGSEVQQDTEENEWYTGVQSPPKAIHKNTLDYRNANVPTTHSIRSIHTQYGINLQSEERHAKDGHEYHVEKGRLRKSLDSHLPTSLDGKVVTGSHEKDGSRRHSTPSKLCYDLPPSSARNSQQKQNNVLGKNTLMHSKQTYEMSEATVDTYEPKQSVFTNHDIFTRKESDKQNEKSISGVEHFDQRRSAQEQDSTYLAWISVHNDGDSSEINSGVPLDSIKPVAGNHAEPQNMANSALHTNGHKAQQPPWPESDDDEAAIANMSKEYDEIVPTHSNVRLESIGQSISLTNVTAKAVLSKRHYENDNGHSKRRSAPTPSAKSFSKEFIAASSYSTATVDSSQKERKPFYICRRCHKIVESGEAIFYSNGRFEIAWHSHCFKCSTCEKRLSTSDHGFLEYEPYCLEHYDSMTNIPKCSKCHQLIHDSSYTSAAGNSWHQHHFICKCCKRPLIDSKFVFVDSKHPFCIPCHTQHYPKQCKTCQERISPQEPYVQAGSSFWHSNNSCLFCSSCNGGLVKRSLFFRKDGRLYCNRYCALREM